MELCPPLTTLHCQESAKESARSHSHNRAAH